MKKITRQLNLFQEHFPKKSYATDNFGQMSILPKIEAIQKRYIQPNTNQDIRWMLYDIDSRTSSTDWIDLDAPSPNIMVINKINGHGHYFYGLETPVYQQSKIVRRKSPYRYMAAVDIALTWKLNADPGYVKLLAKNPLRPDAWSIVEIEQESYDLESLSKSLDLGKLSDFRRKLPPVGYGRNCELFDSARRFAYREIRENVLSFDFFRWGIECFVRYENEQFSSPLPYSEIRSISKSIATWTWNHMSSSGFKKWADNRRKKSARVRHHNSMEKALKARHLRESGCTVKEISEVLNLSFQQVYKLI